MEKPQLVNFIAKVLEESGFKVYKNFKTSSQVVDIYAVLPTSMGDFGVVVGCKNYDKQWEVGIDVLKEMEMIGKTLKASKVTIVTSSSFSAQAIKYGTQRNIKLVDRKNLIALAKKFAEKERNKKGIIKNKRIDENIDQADIPIGKYDQITELDDFKSQKQSYYNQFTIDNFNSDSSPYESLEDYEADKNYYESAVGYSPNENYETSNYENYRDEYYQNEFLNSNIYNSGYYSSEIGNSSNPSRLGKMNQNAKKSRFNFRKNKKTNNTSMNKFKNKGNKTKAVRKIINTKNLVKTGKPIFNTLEPLLNHTISQIIIVILVSYLLSFILGAVAKIPTGFLGIIELVIALILSYGMALYSAENKKDGTNILIKGTIVFFISLICLMIIIVLIR